MSQQQRPSPAEMYQQYFVPGIHARWTPLFLEYADPKPGERVLDVACGTGIVARNAAPLVGTEGMVAGVDINPDMLDVARDLPEPAGSAIEWKQGQASALPDGTYDLVTCQQGLQFFPDRAAAVQEMRRVLASDGRAVVSVWRGLEHHTVYEALCEAEAQYLDISIEEVSTPFTLGDADELRSLLAEAGFQRVEIGSESSTVEFPSPDQFVTLTLFAAAALLPEFAEMDQESRFALVQTVSQEIDATLREYIEGDTICFPMHAHIAVAHA